MASTAPVRIGAYRLSRQLGAGGMGAVYLGQHEKIPEQRVAIKLLHAQLADMERSRERFFNEARAISIVSHPGLVKIFDFGQEGEQAFIIMELLQGESLAQRSERLRAAGSRIPVPQVVELVSQMAEALSAAHARGIVHRDLKPENVFIIPDPVAPGGERSKILDFGIAKFLTDAPGRKTTVGLVLGTPTYMAPEQCEGREDLSDKVDVYALGVMLYEMLSGQPPFLAEATGALLRQHMFKPPPPLVAAEGVSAQVTALVMDMLAKDPGARPTMAEVQARLGGRRVATGRRRGVVLGAVVLGAVLSLSAVAAWRGLRPAAVGPGGQGGGPGGQGGGTGGKVPDKAAADKAAADRAAADKAAADKAAAQQPDQAAPGRTAPDKGARPDKAGAPGTEIAPGADDGRTPGTKAGGRRRVPARTQPAVQAPRSAPPTTRPDDEIFH